MKNAFWATGLALMSLIAAYPTWAEVGTPPAARPTAMANTAQTFSGTYRLQCWQSGVKIIDEQGKGDYSWTLPQNQTHLSFRRGLDNLPSIYLSTNGYTACLVKKVEP